MDQRRPVSPPPPAIRADVRVLAEQCKGCQFCVEFCPMGVLELSKAFNAKGYRYPVVVKDECVDCRLCLRICPEYAIFPIPRRSAADDERRAEEGKRTAAEPQEAIA